MPYNHPMSWASRRRFIYGLGVSAFFALIIGGPILYYFATIPATCTDGKLNQGETSIDKGGPCPLLDPQQLSPASVLWTRSFRVRDGSYNSIAYVQNSNKNAGARSVGYRFGLYDQNNVLVAERTGRTYIMPGAVTPVFAGAIDTGNRIVTHTYFEFTDPIRWERLQGAEGIVSVSDRTIQTTDTTPRITALVRNESVNQLNDLVFSAAAFDALGNAIAASQTTLPFLGPRETREIVFTWPDPFSTRVGRLDIITLIAPTVIQ